MSVSSPPIQQNAAMQTPEPKRPRLTAGDLNQKASLITSVSWLVCAIALLSTITSTVFNPGHTLTLRWPCLHGELEKLPQ